MPIMGFRADGDENVYVYLESKSGSAIVGVDAADDNRLKIDASTTIGISPDSSPMAIFDPRLDSTSGAGDITFIPKTQTSGINAGLPGEFVITQGNLVVSGLSSGVAQTDALGTFSSTKGTDGQLLIGSTAGVPAWANLTAGTGISISNASHGITISANGSSVIETITGNSGGAISPTAGNINIVTANATAKFVGSGSTETLDFGTTTNLSLGTSLASLSSGTNNTGLGTGALSPLTSGQDMTAVGWKALNAITAGNSNTAIGSQALIALNTTAGHGYNTALGAAAGFALTTGEYNTLIGVSAGLNYTTSESSNILINHNGIVGESNTLRIGATTGSGSKSLTKSYICGIDGVNVGSVAKVVTMASDQLGTASITGGTNISISTGANVIQVNATGFAAFSWVSTAGGTASVNTGYIANNGASLTTVTLPSTAAVGNVVRMAGASSGGWKVAQNSGQTIHVSGSNTTTGVGGYLASTTQYDAVELICITTNTDWAALSVQGNLTIV